MGRFFEDAPEDDEWEPMEHVNVSDFVCGEGDDVGGSLLDRLYGGQAPDDDPGFGEGGDS